jgi:putative solute:sodium symporter small subunit
MSNNDTIGQAPPGRGGVPQEAAGPDDVYHHEGGNLPAHDHHDQEVVEEAEVRSYWHDNLRLLGLLLAIWAVVGFGFSIILVEPLNAIKLGGFKLGFWFAQQGAIYTFVVLIFVYAFQMKRIERRHGVDDDE